MDSVLYEEPSNPDLLALASLFVVVNIVRVIFDSLGHVGILGDLSPATRYSCTHQI